jgi:protein PhnA
MEIYDAFGNILEDGDSVQTTKELKVKGTKVTLKKGTVVKNIRLSNSNPEEINCSAPSAKKLVLRTEFVKKR